MAKIQSQGVGESPLNIPPAGTFEPTAVDWSKLTVNGVPIPEHLQGLITYEMTDQGWAEKNEGKEPVRVRVTRDSADNTRLARRDFVMDGGDLSNAPDPLREVMGAHVKPGFTPRFLSKARVESEGSTRGYEIAKQANGEPVRYKNMVLGQIPTEVYIERRKNAVNRSAMQLQQVAANAKDAGLRDYKD